MWILMGSLWFLTRFPPPSSFFFFLPVLLLPSVGFILSFSGQSFHTYSICSIVTWGEWLGRKMPLPVLVLQGLTRFLCAINRPSEPILPLQLQRKKFQPKKKVWHHFKTMVSELKQQELRYPGISLIIYQLEHHTPVGTGWRLMFQISKTSGY